MHLSTLLRPFSLLLVCSALTACPPPKPGPGPGGEVVTQATATIESRSGSTVTGTATFEQVGLTPKMLLGAADMYTWIATTPPGHETPENRDKSRDLDGLIAELAKTLTPTTSRQ